MEGGWGDSAATELGEGGKDDEIVEAVPDVDLDGAFVAVVWSCGLLNSEEESKPNEGTGILLEDFLPSDECLFA